MRLCCDSPPISGWKALIHNVLVFIVREQLAVMICPRIFFWRERVVFPLEFTGVRSLQDPEFIENPAPMLLAGEYTYNGCLRTCHAQSC